MTTATSTRVLIVGIFLAIEVYIAFHYAASIMEEIGLIMEKVGLLMEKIPPLEKIGTTLTVLYQFLGSVTAALAFPVTITVLLVMRASSTKFIIAGIFLAVYYNGMFL